MDKTALCVKKKSDSVLRGLKSPPSKKKNRNQLTNETNKTNHYNIYEQSLVPNDFVFCRHMGWVCALVHVMGIRVYTERPCGNQKFRCESQVVDYGLTDGFYIKSQGLFLWVWKYWRAMNRLNLTLRWKDFLKSQAVKQNHS